MKIARKNIRLKDYNYKNDGYYFITNNTHYSKVLITNEVKNIVKQTLLELPTKFPGLSIYYYAIMPTHVHVILQLLNARSSVPNIWRVFKSKTTVLARKHGLSEQHLWQLNYFEHVIRNENALEKIIEYIHNNPFKENLPFEEIYGDRIPDITRL